MELREYLSVYRAYNRVRQQTPTQERITFPEFAILCRLYLSRTALKTSDIAEYQNCLRPTMTHRTKHLSHLGLIDRVKGNQDRRNIVCSLTDEGVGFVRDLAAKTVERMRDQDPSVVMTQGKLRKVVDAMGTITSMSGDLTLLMLDVNGNKNVSISEIVNAVGLLQPTVSMAVASLVDEGYLVRINPAEGIDPRFSLVAATDKGIARGEDIKKRIEKLDIGE